MFSTEENLRKQTTRENLPRERERNCINTQSFSDTLPACLAPDTLCFALAHSKLRSDNQPGVRPAERQLQAARSLRFTRAGASALRHHLKASRARKDPEKYPDPEPSSHTNFKKLAGLVSAVISLPLVFSDVSLSRW